MRESDSYFSQEIAVNVALLAIGFLLIQVSVAIIAALMVCIRFSA